MASIHKRAKGYSVRWREGSGRNRSRQCPSYAAAKKLQREIEEAHSLGRDWAPARAHRLPDVAELFAVAIRERARGLRPGTVYQLEVATGLFIDSLKTRHRGRLTPDLLTSQALGDYFDHLVQIRSCSPSTATARVRKVEGLWRDLYDHEEYGDIVPRPRKLKTLPEDPAPLMPAPTWAEMDAAVNAASGWYHHLFLLARYTGLRKSQLMRLRWEDVDLDRRMLRIRPELGKTRHERKGRIIPISPHLVEELAGWGVREGWLIDTGPRNSKREPHRAWVLEIWERAKVRREVWGSQQGRRGQPLHAFRHGFITGLVLEGTPIHLVQQLVGHKPRSVTEAVYIDPALLMPELKKVVEKIPAVGTGTVIQMAQEG